MQRKWRLIIGLVLALVVTSGLYAFTYLTATATMDVTVAGDEIATAAVAASQPDWDSIVPQLGGTEILRPNAPGDEHNISYEAGAPYPDHYQNVDEVVPDEYNTTVYVKDVNWERDLYNIADHSVGTGNIKSVTVYARAIAKETPVQASLKIALKSGVTVSESGGKTLTTSWADYSHSWLTNPATGGAFTWTDIDSLQVGVSLRECDSGKETYVTQVYVYVNYGVDIYGEVPTGNLFDITPDDDYTGDLAVKVYLTNTGALVKAYQYLNMKLYLEGSVEAGETPDYQLLTLDNGEATFNLKDYAPGTYTLSVGHGASPAIPGGSYGLVSTDTSQWEVGWTVTPEFYCLIMQR